MVDGASAVDADAVVSSVAPAELPPLEQAASAATRASAAPAARPPARRRLAITIASRGQRTRARQGPRCDRAWQAMLRPGTAGPLGGLAVSAAVAGGRARRFRRCGGGATVRPGWRDDQATVHGHLRPGPVPPRRPAPPDRDRPIPGRRARPRRVLAAAVRAAADGRPGPRRHPARVGGVEHRVPAGRPAGRVDGRGRWRTSPRRWTRSPTSTRWPASTCPSTSSGSSPWGTRPAATWPCGWLPARACRPARRAPPRG